LLYPAELSDLYLTFNTKAVQKYFIFWKVTTLLPKNGKMGRLFAGK
jgi:hypothetical protein